MTPLNSAVYSGYVLPRLPIALETQTRCQTGYTWHYMKTLQYEPGC